MIRNLKKIQRIAKKYKTLFTTRKRPNEDKIINIFTNEALDSFNSKNDAMIIPHYL